MKFASFEFDREKDRLGEGPQSEVYRARDTRLGRTVALKILRPHIEFDPEAVTRFEREAKHTSTLAHPNIATIYEYGQDKGTSYIVLEYLEGQTLDKILQEGRPIPFDDAVRYGLQVASALELVHQHHLIHRDLKPANIMVLADGKVKLLDFGICRSTGESNITQEGMLVGTVLYMSPEQVRGQDLNARSDVFAFGAVFYHMLTGELPFPGRTFPEVCMAILDGNPRPPSELRAGLPEALETFVMKCLAREPKDRFEDGSDLIAELEQVDKRVKDIKVASSAVKLRGRIAVPPLEVLGGDEHARLFAGSLRHDLHSELKRSTGLEIQLLDADQLEPSSPGTFVLRASLELRDTRGVLEYRLRRLGQQPGEHTELAHERLEHSDSDEWGLQGQLVRALARAVRRKLSEDTIEALPPLARDPKSADALARRAHEVLHRGTTKHLLASVSGFRRAISMDPVCALAYAGLAEALVRKFVYWDGDRTFLEEAFDSARRALQLDPNCAEAHTSLGFAYAMTGQSEDALREYRMAIRLDEKEWLAHRFMGAVLARQGNFKLASALLRKAIGLEPHHIASYDHLYNVLLRMDRYEDGIEIAEQGIAAARRHLRDVPEAQEARLHLALLLARMKLADDARRVLAEAREFAPKDGYTLFHIACVLSLLGARAEAMEALCEAQARGYYLRSELWSNSDLDALRELPEFIELAS